MTNSTTRFSRRVDNYIKYRPGYPLSVLKLLATECGLTPCSIIADVGSGTGILSELFLQHGNTVYGIEPNKEMREAAERLLKDYPNFHSIEGSAEAPSLAQSSVNFVTAGQAFHWFVQQRARDEFIRILKSAGWTVLLWNERRLESSQFLRDLEEVLLKFGTDYEQVRHENAEPDLPGFFGQNGYKLAVFENLQHLDLEGLKGRILSSSYTPEAGHPSYQPMVDALCDIFTRHQIQGKVTIEYDTKVFYGQLETNAGTVLSDE